MKNNHLLKKNLSIISISALCIESGFAVGSERFEEVIVTANKRVETKSNVAASVTVLQGEHLDKMNVNRLEDIVSLTDNFHFTESGLSTQIRIRGIGSGNNQGFEQSVAQYVDGVYYGRSQLFRAPIFDIDRIEILRGSQNSVFGKDSIGGGISINTAPATQDFEGRLGVGYNAKFGRYETNFMLNGALTNSINARVALQVANEDGAFLNTTKGRSEPHREEEFARAKFDWQASDNFQIKAKIESGSFNLSGRPFEIVQDISSPLTLDLIARKPGNTALQSIPSTFNNILTTLVGQKPFESEANWERQTNSPEISRNHVNNISLDSLYVFGDYESHTTVAHVNYGFNELCDCDYVPATIFTLALEENYQQTSFDSYIKNQPIEGYRWLMGLYGERTNLHYNDNFYVPTDSILKPLGSSLPGSGVNREFSQDGETISLYGELDIPIGKESNLIVGVRFSHNSKDAQRVLEIVDADNLPLFSLPLACTYLYGLKADTVQSMGLPYDCGAAKPDLKKGFSPGHNLDESRTESNVTPFITIKNSFSTNLKSFMTVKKGHKSGGFDARSNSALSFDFKQESALTFEVGFRSTSDNGIYQNGITMFHTTYEDLQVSQYDGALGFNVANAKNSESKGFEFDGRIQTSDQLAFVYSAGYVDIKYKDFKNGNCYQGQVPDGLDLNEDNKRDLCDYTGKTPPFVPAKTFNIGIESSFAIFGGMLVSSANAQFVGEHNVHENLDPNGIQKSYSMINANLHYHYRHVDIVLSGNNLTNEYVKTYESNVPLSGSQFGTRTLYAFAKPPRSANISLSYRF